MTGMMMMMTIRRWSIILFSVFVPIVAYAQEKDFGVWFGVSAEHKLTKKFELDLSSNVRTFQNSSKVQEAFLEGGLTYNFNKYLLLAASYRITENIENENSYYLRHKYFFDIKGSLPLSDFVFSCRFKFQTMTRTYIEHYQDNYPEYTGRIKFKVVYKTPVFPLDPYMYAETFISMFSDLPGSIEQNRFAAGLQLNIVRGQTLEAEYIFKRDYTPHTSDINIISINYDLKF